MHVRLSRIRLKMKMNEAKQLQARWERLSCAERERLQAKPGRGRGPSHTLCVIDDIDADLTPEQRVAAERWFLHELTKRA